MNRNIIALTCFLALVGCARSDVYPLFPAEQTAGRDLDYSEGFAYSHGIGVPRDYAKAVAAYKRAADRGDGRAMNNLGIMAIQGRGSDPSPGAARDWFEKAAEAGSSSARYNLGLLDELGVGSSRDPSRARLNMQIAAAQGHVLAKERLGTSYSEVGTFEEESCPTCPAESLDQLRSLANGGDPSARYNLGVRYLRGIGTSKNPAEAARWFTLAARSGYAPAARQIAQMHLRGEGVGRSKVLAHAWLNLAARDRGEEGRAARNEMDALETSMETEEIEKAQRIAADYAVKGR